MEIVFLPHTDMAFTHIRIKRHTKKKLSMEICYGNEKLEEGGRKAAKLVKEAAVWCVLLAAFYFFLFFRLSS